MRILLPGAPGTDVPRRSGRDLSGDARAACVIMMLCVLTAAFAMHDYDAAHAARANTGNTSHGEVGVDMFDYAVGPGERVAVHITGILYEAGRMPVHITIVHPDDISETHHVLAARDGGFVSHYALDYYTSDPGTYFVSAKAGGKVLGQVAFEMRYMGGPPGSGLQDGRTGTSGNPAIDDAMASFLTVNTDRRHYEEGDTVRIYGSSGMRGEKVMIGTSLGPTYRAVDVGPDGTYGLEIDTAAMVGRLAGGTYEVVAGSPWSQAPASATFTITVGTATDDAGSAHGQENRPRIPAEPLQESPDTGRNANSEPDAAPDDRPRTERGIIREILEEGRYEVMIVAAALPGIAALMVVCARRRR